MRVAFIVNSSKGTITKVTVNLILKLEKDFDIKISLICLNYKEEGSLIEEIKDRHILQENRGVFKYFTYIHFIKKIINEQKIQLCVSSENAATAYMILSNTAVKKVGIFHAPVWQSINNGFKVYLMDMIALKFLYKRLDQIICVSTTASSSFEPSNKIKIIYNVHDIDYIRKKGDEELNEAEKQVFDKQNILMLGDICPNKSQAKAILAFKQIYTYNPNAKLVIMGNIVNEKYFDFLKDLISSLNLNQSVVFENFNKNPYKFINNSEMIFSTSISEGLPGVLIEAAILKIPFIATNSSTGIWEILQVEGQYQENLKSNFYVKNNAITPNLYTKLITQPNVKDNFFMEDVNAIVTAYKDILMRKLSGNHESVNTSRFEYSATEYYNTMKNLIQV